MPNIFTKNHLILTFGLWFSSFFVQAESFASTLFGDNSRWSIDASARANRNTDKPHNAYTYSLGLDVHKVFSRGNEDLGSLMLQPYLVTLNNVNAAPFYFDDGDDQTHR
ncbi:hypothetical protein [Paraglaciecola polaris]|uniref:hypothetical protein n=1 Tax=Paraglaciecola polaris TaxID=222814 RepID=UPI0030EE77FF|tara:strand:- start:690 stop:1016 length:327 start_codon:yes stop_codon:yes gene_type:complete